MDRGFRKNWIQRVLAASLILASLASSGCTSVLTPITGIPVSQLPDALLGVRRSEFEQVPPVLLSLPPSDVYRLDEGDILSVYIDGILPYSPPSQVPVPPPVNMPSAGSTLPPSIGYPIPVQEDGFISLPLLRPFSVRGMTVKQAAEEVERRYREGEFLSSDNTYPSISLMKTRDHRVTVIRSNASSSIGSDGTAAGYTLVLPEGQNDVLAALTQSGGLPGFNERNEVIIYKASRIPVEQRHDLLQQLVSGCVPCGTPNPIHNLPQFAHMGEPMSDSFTFDDQLIENRMVVRIPLRYPPGQQPHIPTDDITLVTGDIVVVESRDTELFYTGGLLRGGQFPLPRDYDLDVLGALALAGQGVGSQQGRGGGGGGGQGGGLIQGIGGTNPTQLYIIRKLPCGRTYNIAVDLQLAMNNSTENILVQPGDTLILRFKPEEELVNFGIGTFFTFGIRELFSN